MAEKRTVTDMNGVRYELTHLLGRGGQGAVYAAKNGRLAVKLVGGRSVAERERMRNQLAQVRRLPLNDLHLAKPLEMLREPHLGYVMELLKGMVPIKALFMPPKGEAPTLEWYLWTGGLRRRLRLLARTAQILARLHGRGLVYADPSPANIFISQDIDFDEVWLIDADNLRYESGAGDGVYTPGYGAPELVVGKSGVNTLTDVHAFAVIAFQALALLHPLIGDLVDQGEPDLEERALAGELPWVDDPEDEINRASFGVPRGWVLSGGLRRIFEQTLGAGRTNPRARPGAAEWAERLFGAADATIRCSSCGGTFYFNQPGCAWCDTPRPTFATAEFRAWDPAHPERVADSPMLAHAAVAAGETIELSRRQAFGDSGPQSHEPVVSITLSKGKLALKSTDGHEYRLELSSTESVLVGGRARTLQLGSAQRTALLHFGEAESPHRVASFNLREGGGT